LIAVPLWRRLFVASDALVFYLRQFMWPAQLAVDYGRTPESVLAHWSAYATGVVVAAIALFAWYFRTRMREVWIGSALFVALLLPVLGIVPFDFQHYSTVADHYLYMALLGPALIAGAILSRAPRWGFAVMAIVLACLAVKSHAQTRTWQDGQTLFTHMVDVNPRSFLGHNNLGFEMVAAGAPADAIPHYQEAIRLFPGYRDAHANLGWVRSRLGDRQGAIDEYRQALAIDPDFLQARQGLASSLAGANQLEESLVAMRRVLELVPDSGVWHANTGAVLARLGRSAEAIVEYEEALRLEPGMARAVQALAVLKPKRQ
jgi:tetratricopeptide (TPR) repeat protein